jgi:hypothetical protein
MNAAAITTITESPKPTKYRLLLASQNTLHSRHDRNPR